MSKLKYFNPNKSFFLILIQIQNNQTIKNRSSKEKNLDFFLKTQIIMKIKAEKYISKYVLVLYYCVRHLISSCFFFYKKTKII